MHSLESQWCFNTPVSFPPRPPNPKALRLSWSLPYKITPFPPTSGTSLFTPEVLIDADDHLPGHPMPSARPNRLLPIFLFIHGGGWIHGTREDYGRTWFIRFLGQWYIVVSMDYRLCPESSFQDICEDVRDIETWLRDPESEFAKATTSGDLKADRRKIIVAGASAGALWRFLQ